MNYPSPPKRLNSATLAPVQRTRSQSRRRRLGLRGHWTLGFILPVGLLVVWELLSRIGVFPPNLLPAPSAIALTLWTLTLSGELLIHIGITLYRVFLGFLIGGVLATILGALTGYSRVANQLLDPLFQALRNIPSLAWVPLFILWLGIAETSKIALIAVGVFFPVYLTLMAGIQQVDRKLVEVGRVYRFSQAQLIWRVFLPATLPSYIVGLRNGLGLGWMFVVAAEIMGASRGLGFLLIDGQTTGRPDIIIASILLFAIMGKLTDTGLVAIGRRLVSWQDSYSLQAQKN
ncbi:ABC transporter permease [Oculatella sp. FACHB-28]|uniref:ABC transporter permease n=1 Tax=Cyanophyceae TaxID=3028117 RepID=UPI0016870CF9|nr:MULTISPECIES: ABC transporter permease [Cyanophyceae]MBD1870567.1 ABC transporter permease [Cyanobacteria bacterium FACHB-471]MBD2056115.1 ABC transporter permease [Oculatella sp. FACHB-28]MBD2071960.1 ABC transporter permease [Leptolyngbya sp. FACHB-671]